MHGEKLVLKIFYHGAGHASSGTGITAADEKTFFFVGPWYTWTAVSEIWEYRRIENLYNREEQPCGSTPITPRS